METCLASESGGCRLHAEELCRISFNGPIASDIKKD